MSENLPKLKLGLPKGSLEESTFSLFERAGWKIRKHERNYFPEIDDPQLAVSLCRVQEMGGYIANGILDAGITGLDWLKEGGQEDSVIRLADLVYSKNSLRPCRWVLAVDGNSPVHSPKDLNGKRVATEVRGMAREYFERLGVRPEILYSYGATEAKIVEGLADAIVEVTETGTTISAHGLRIIDEVMVSHPVLIVNPESWKDPAKRAKLEQIRLLLEGALRAYSLVALKMNAPTAKLERITKILPALTSPTISPLQDSAWVSLETVVRKDQVRDLIPALRELGAEGIIEYSLNKAI